MCTCWRRPRRRSEELSVDEWLEVGRKLVARGVRIVELFGGDVLLRKDVLFPLARQLHRAGVRVHMATNCNLLDEATARELVESVHTIYLSTDGVGETHDGVRGVDGTFHRVCRALECLREARGDRTSPVLVCITTLSKHNFRDVRKIAQFAARIGYDQIEIDPVGEITPDCVQRSRMGNYTPSPIFLQAGESVLIPNEGISTLRRLIRQVRAEFQQGNGRAKKFPVETGDIDYLSDAQIAKGRYPFRRCFMERCTVVIGPYGNLMPCVLCDTYSVGNVRSGDLDRSWETAQRARFRAYRDTGRLEMCLRCHMTPVWNKTARDVIRRAYLASRLFPTDGSE